MRTIFGGALLFSAISAVIMGGALAWTSSRTISDQASTVGEIGFALIYEPSNSLIGPDNGVNVVVGTGYIDVEGNFNLAFGNGSVVFTDVATVIPGGQTVCASSNFSGVVYPVGYWASPAASIPPNEPFNPAQSPAFQVGIAVKPGAPNACQGATVFYDVLITLKTASN